MKKNILLASLLLLTLGFTYAQKKNITDAALIMRKYNPMKNIEDARKKVIEAKGFIDQAAVSAETKDDYKMFLYRGQVYYALTELASIDKMSGKEIEDAKIEEYAKISKESFLKVSEDPKKRWVTDMESFFNPRLTMILTMADQSYKKEDFDNAAIGYATAYVLKDFMGQTYKEAEEYASVSLSYAVNKKLQSKSYDSAILVASQVYEILPKNVNVLITMINIYLQKGDITSSEKYLNEALAIDPQNKQLYYVLGTAYMDLNEFEKAEKALLEALNIDKEYSEAQYQIGAHYFNWARQIKMEASQLDYKDPKVAEYDEKIKKLNENALVYLVPWVENNPEECSVYQVISQLYYQLENEEKDLEYNTKFKECKKK